jgi:hypothetical protein
MEPTLDILDRKAQDYRPTVRARGRRIRKHETIDHPLHFLMRKFHVDLYCGLAG